MTLFQEALAFTLRMEGAWYPGDEERDTNPTMKGITQKTYDTFRASHGMVTRSVRAIGVTELEDIYYQQYWKAITPTAVVDPLHRAVFDMAVNAGPSRATKILQSLLGTKPDGRFGPITNRALWLWVGSEMELFNRYQTERLAFYGGLALVNKRLRPNLISWTRRVVLLSREVYHDADSGE